MADEAAVFGFLEGAVSGIATRFDALSGAQIGVLAPQLQDPAGALGFAIRGALGAAAAAIANTFVGPEGQPSRFRSGADYTLAELIALSGPDFIPPEFSESVAATGTEIEAQRAALGVLETDLNQFLQFPDEEVPPGSTFFVPGTVDPATLDVALIAELAETFQAESPEGAQSFVNTSIDGNTAYVRALRDSARANAMQNVIAVGRDIGSETFATTQDFTLPPEVQPEIIENPLLPRSAIGALTAARAPSRSL